jgi:putative transposase
VDEVIIKDIREAVNKGLALESERFKDEIETNLKRRVRPAKMGRPRKPADDESKQKSSR